MLIFFWEVKVFVGLAHIKFKVRSGFMCMISASFVYL